jgi:HPt (histidine-containing phosphotransfer) domain-containing protein
MPESKPPPKTVIHSLGSTWSQSDLGEDFELAPLSVIGELDPSGDEGAVNDILKMLLKSLDPMLAKVEAHRAAGSPEGIKFEAHKLQSASGQIGAMRLSAACAAISRYFSAGGSLAPGPIKGALGDLVDSLVSEAVRVQRRLRKLVVK